MTNAVATLPVRPKSVTLDMADRFGMEPTAFERTLRATVFPANAPAEEFAAFLLVAKEYDLNPITKEIYAFPKKGGGIQPIVSIDGWMNLINSHPAMDGMEFEDIHDDAGELKAIRCRIYRKDRSRPVEVTEYLAECIRATDPWKMKHRMLRHKAAIQCARYAFGFAGIMEPDEAEKIIDATPTVPTPPAPPPAAIAPPKPPQAELPADPALTPPAPPAAPVPPAPPSARSSTPYAELSQPAPEPAARDWLADFESDLSSATSAEAFDELAAPYLAELSERPMAERTKAQGIYERLALKWSEIAP